jgi:hypothetical protein
MDIDFDLFTYYLDQYNKTNEELVQYVFDLTNQFDKKKHKFYIYMIEKNLLTNNGILYDKNLKRWCWIEDIIHTNQDIISYLVNCLNEIESVDKYLDNMADQIKGSLKAYINTNM